MRNAFAIRVKADKYIDAHHGEIISLSVHRPGVENLMTWAYELGQMNIVDDLVSPTTSISQLYINIKEIWNKINDIAANMKRIGEAITESSPLDSGVTEMSGPFPGSGTWKVWRLHPDGDYFATGTISFPYSALRMLRSFQLRICGEGLRVEWGHYNRNGGQVYSRNFSGFSAFTAARKWIDGEAKKLQDALDEREDK